MNLLLHHQEVGVCGASQNSGFQRRFESLKGSDRTNMVDDVPGMAPSGFDPVFVVESAIEGLYGLRLVIDSGLVAIHPEDVGESLLLRTPDLDLELDPPKKGFVQKIPRIQVGGKDEDAVEG